VPGCTPVQGCNPFCAAVQALKIIRYTARLIAAVSPPGSEQRQRFEALQSSVGTSRCAALTMLTCQQHYQAQEPAVALIG
jgi:hypothetical protein